MMRWFYLSLGLTLLAAAASVYVLFFQYDRMPELVPTHWGIDGKADGWTPKSNIYFVFFLVPSMMVAILAMTLVLPWLSPKHFEVERFGSTFGYVMALINAMCLYIHGILLFATVNPDTTVPGRWIIGGICLMFALMGNVLGQVRRNFWMGVRTPWTLASEVVWNQTHRLAAWLFVAAGIVGVVLVVLDVSPVITFVLIIVSALVPVFYSLVLYKILERQGKV